MPSSSLVRGVRASAWGAILAAAFAPAREVFQEVDETLGQKLSKVMFEGPAEDLTLTANTQPALMAVSLAVLRVLEQEGGVRLADKAAVVAGHSLGEYSALAAPGRSVSAPPRGCCGCAGMRCSRLCRLARGRWPHFLA